jgi:hypothetical protein
LRLWRRFAKRRRRDRIVIRHPNRFQLQGRLKRTPGMSSTKADLQIASPLRFHNETRSWLVQLPSNSAWRGNNLYVRIGISGRPNRCNRIAARPTARGHVAQHI